MRRTAMLALMTAMLGCGVSQQEYAAKETEANDYKRQLDEQVAKSASLEQRLTALESELDTERQHLAAVGSKAASTTAQKSQLEAKTAALQAETAELKDKQAKVVNTELLFTENSSKLTTEAKHALDAAADAIAQLRDKGVIVTAYTDDLEGGGQKGGQLKRWQLSSARATEVAKYLVSRGLDPKLIGVAGFGEGRPLAPNDSLSNRASNRRAELVLTPSEFNLKTIEVDAARLRATGH